MSEIVPCNEKLDDEKLEIKIKVLKKQKKDPFIDSTSGLIYYHESSKNDLEQRSSE